MAQKLSISILVRVAVSLAPLAAQRRTFGTLLIAGDSDVINASERIRTYTDIASVASDFGTSAPEYLAALLYFGQSPMPYELMIGRWLRETTAGLIEGGILTTEQQLIATWTAIDDGEFTIDVDGVEKELTALDFGEETNLNGVAEVITTALGSSAVCSWTGTRFVITSATTGVSSTVGYAVAVDGGTGTPIETMLKLTSATALAPVDGQTGETPAACAAILADKSSQWYGLTFAAAAENMPSSSQLQAVGAYIEAASPTRILGITETDTRVLDAEYTTDLASVFKALLYKRTLVQYSANLYAVCSLMGRAFSVSFTANKSTITLMWKQEPGVVAETLTETQAATLEAKRCNVFVNYQNDTAIIQTS